DEVHAAGRRPDAGCLVAECLGEAVTGVVPDVAHAVVSLLFAMPSRMISALRSGGTSATQAPMAASEPARNFSLSADRRGEVSCKDRRTVSRPVSTGAWCQAAM